MLFQCPQCGRKFELPDHAFRLHCPCGYQGQFAEAPKQSVDAKQVDRQARVAAKVAATQRLIGWLKRFRLPTESGVGDTAQRLILKSCKYPKTGAALKRLLNRCGCERQDAVERLNREYPYA